MRDMPLTLEKILVDYSLYGIGLIAIIAIILAAIDLTKLRRIERLNKMFNAEAYSEDKK